MVFCKACGHQIHESAISCPQCGAIQNPGKIKNQTVAVLLALFLGGLGIHRFYLGKTITGVLYLLFFWTGIPAFIAWIEAIVYALSSQASWAAKYNSGRPGEPISKALTVAVVATPILIFVLGIGAAIMVPKMMGRTDDARVAAAKTDVATLMQALKLYKMDNGRFPTTEQGLQALVMNPPSGPAAKGWKEGGYIDKLPRDPWGNPYQYLNPGIYGAFDVFTLGADGQPSGTGYDADVGSWDL
jgi:general secretion pathway protein G